MERLVIPVDEELTLRQYTPDDADLLHALMLANRADLVNFSKELPGLYPTPQDLRGSITNPRNPDRIRLGIWNEIGVLVGSMNFEPYKENKSTPEIDYFVGRRFQGRGIATRATEGIINFFSKQPNLEAVVAIVDTDNIPSMTVIEKNNFRNQGLIKTKKGTYIEYVRRLGVTYSH